MTGAAAASQRRPGVGLSWTRELDPVLQQHRDLVDWVEFEPQTTWLVAARGVPPRAPGELLHHLQQLPQRKLIHSVAAPVGGTGRSSTQHLALLRQAVRALRAPYLSEHLSFNASHGVSTGFFMPPRQTDAQVRVVADNILRLQDAVGVPVAIENGTSYLRVRNDEMPDGEFIARVAEAADCGLLLDLHNAYANGVNGRQALAEFLASLPLDRVWELHLAGGMERSGFWLDAHSGPVPQALWQQVQDLPGRLPALQAAVFEVFPSFLADAAPGLVADEIRRIHRWLDEAVPTPRAGVAQMAEAAVVRPLPEAPAGPGPHDGPAWEAALTELLTGQAMCQGSPDARALRDELAAEPGVPLVQDLVFSFRASMVVQVLRLSAQLLLASVGPMAFRRMLQDSFEHHPPQMYATLEAQAFAEHVLQRDWRVPYLMDLLRYELALTQTLVDEQPRVVEFSFEPMPLLRALAEGRLPDEVPQAGQFEIELLPDETAERHPREQLLSADSFWDGS